MPYGTRLEILARNAGWLQVKLPDGRTSWVELATTRVADYRAAAEMMASVPG